MRSGLLIAARYRLDRQIGNGGMAEVWRAEDEVLARPVAVKLVCSKLVGGAGFRERFRDEARAAAALTHPRIVTVHDYGEASDIDGTPIPYIVMELLEGETLAERLAREPLPAEKGVLIGVQIAEALTAAHDAGVVHHDIKPENVFLARDGAKVLDFGIATARDSQATGDLTEPLFGTPAYMAPERHTEPQGSPAADVYSLGVLLTEALTGRRELTGSWPPEVPDDVAAICVRCREQDPDDRPAAAQVRSALTESALYPTDEDLGVSGTRSWRMKRFAASPARLLGIATVIGLVAAAGITAVILPLFDAMNHKPASSIGQLPDPEAGLDDVEPSTPRSAPSDPPETVSPPPNRIITPRRAAPSRAAAVNRLNRVRDLVAVGKDRGEVRDDVALDLDQVIAGVQSELVADQNVALGELVYALQSKVATRLREGGLTQARANVLIVALDAVIAPASAAPA